MGEAQRGVGAAPRPSRDRAAKGKMYDIFRARSVLVMYVNCDSILPEEPDRQAGMWRDETVFSWP